MVKILAKDFSLKNIVWRGFRMKNIKVDNAVILAAGLGSRFAPLTFSTPKGLVLVNGKPMLEYQIEQLHEVGITDIIIVVGHLSECFEYLVGKYGVELIYNPDYNTKNSLSSVYYSRKHFKNTYLLASDNLLTKNIFNTYESKSWYCSPYIKGATAEWCLNTNSNGLIESVAIGGKDSYIMYGPAFFTETDSEIFIRYVDEYFHTTGTDNFYWEHILIDKPRGFPMYVYPQDIGVMYEFENLEELRLYDKSYNLNSNNVYLRAISEFFQIPEYMIVDINCIEAETDNQAFSFKVLDTTYIGIVKHSITSIIKDIESRIIFKDLSIEFCILKNL